MTTCNDMASHACTSTTTVATVIRVVRPFSTFHADHGRYLASCKGVTDILCRQSKRQAVTVLLHHLVTVMPHMAHTQWK